MLQLFYRPSANTLIQRAHEAALLMTYKAALFTSQTVWYLIQIEANMIDAIHAISHFSQDSDNNFIYFNWILAFPSGQHSLMGPWFLCY